MPILLPAFVLGGTGFILGILIFVVSKYFHVEEDHRIDDIEGMLPKYNCGACGYAGCRDMAQGLLAKQAKVEQCKPIKTEAKIALMKHLDELFKSELELKKQ
jgi:electron transport complex protein RnfB